MRLFYREVARGNFWVGKDVFDPDIEWEWSSSGGKVVALTRSLGRPHGATSDVTALNAEVWTMRDGKAIAHRSYDTWEEALEAAQAPD